MSAKRGWLPILVLAFLVGSATPALAHAERSGSTPDDGERLKSAPNNMRIEFTEPPIADAAFEVLDGCGRDVVQGIEVQGTEITASLAEGQPGEWSVRTQVVSGIDGHSTKDRWAFSVTGTEDCEAEPDPGDGDPEASAEDITDDGGSFPLLAFAAGTLLVIALALMLRKKSS